jgi:hypothetical protein
MRSQWLKAGKLAWDDPHLAAYVHPSAIVHSDMDVNSVCLAMCSTVYIRTPLKRTVVDV